MPEQQADGSHGSNTQPSTSSGISAHQKDIATSGQSTSNESNPHQKGGSEEMGNDGQHGTTTEYGNVIIVEDSQAPEAGEPFSDTIREAFPDSSKPGFGEGPLRSLEHFEVAPGFDWQGPLGHFEDAQDPGFDSQVFIA
jgi:hypothetical protein